MIKLENAGLQAPRKISLGSGLHSQKRIRAPGSKMIGLRAPQQKFQGSRAPGTPFPLGPWPFDDRRLSVIFLRNNNELLSFAESFAFKVEEMCLQHLSTLSLIGNEPDGLQIEENLGKSKRHFFAL